MPSWIAKSRRRRNDFYHFFLHRARDHRSAVSAVVAGSIAGGLLSVVLLVGVVVREAVDGWHSSQTALFLVGAVCAACATIATWKRLLVGPVLGLSIGVSLLGWAAVNRHDAAIAVILAIPFVGGFVTAARGILILNRLRDLDVPSGGAQP